jgi:hypothetical protein
MEGAFTNRVYSVTLCVAWSAAPRRNVRERTRDEDPGSGDPRGRRAGSTGIAGRWSWTHEYEDVALFAAEEESSEGGIVRASSTALRSASTAGRGTGPNPSKVRMTAGSDRERLAGLLSALESAEIPPLALDALAAGADCEIEGPVGMARMKSLFARRERNSRKAGQPSIGFADSVRALAAYDGPSCVIGYIDDRPRGGYFFQLFLTPDASGVITCFGVKPVPRKKASSERE